MTRRRELEGRRRSLDEIRSILNSMKTLAYMESRKLARYLDAQRAVVGSIESAAADVIGFHPETLPEAAGVTEVRLLIGSERGFCGAFNEEILRRLDADLQDVSGESGLVVAAGRKLHASLDDRTRAAATLLEGASVIEEVEMVLNRIAATLSEFQSRQGAIGVTALYHDGGEGGVVSKRILPTFQAARGSPPGFSHAPHLNLPPRDLLLELTDHYLFSALHAILYASLAAENEQRLQHLEGAVRHLDDRSEELSKRCNALRQEEIIEEIEVILLSAASLDKPA